METEKTPQFTIIIADKPEEEALASIDSSSSSKAAKKQAEANMRQRFKTGLNPSRLGRKKYIQLMSSLYMRSPIQLFAQNSSLRFLMPVEARLCSEQMLLSKKNTVAPGVQ